MEEYKFDTLHDLTRPLFKINAGYQLEHTNNSTYENTEFTGKIIYDFKSCLSNHYKKLVFFLNQYKIKYNLIKLPKNDIYEFRTLDYRMDQYMVCNKTFNQKDSKYILEINFNDLYYN